MTLRLLRHGAAGCTEQCNLRMGAWADVSTQGQFLLDLEFLLNCSPASGTASCVYCRSPPYLHEIAQQFPWIHFFAYEHVFETPEYDPAQPSLVSSAPPTVQVDFNKTVCVQEFSKDMARAMGERGQRERESLLLICHGIDSVRQLALQVLMRPQHALLDIAGSIPSEYLDGDIVLPVYLPGDVLFACMTVKANAKGRSYDSNTYMHEIGAFFLLACNAMLLFKPSL